MAAPKVGLRDALIALAMAAAVAGAVTAASADPKALHGLWTMLTGPQPGAGCDRAAGPRRTASDLDGNCRPAMPPR